MFKNFIDCKICNSLMPRYSETHNSVSPHEGLIPKEIRQMEKKENDIYQCKECGIYYYFSMDYDPGEAMVPSSTDITFIRLNPISVSAHFVAGENKNNFPTKEKENCRRLTTLAVKNLSLINKETPWTIKKFIVETLTDEFIDKSDSRGLMDSLFHHPDPMIAVEAGGDFIFIATEEYPVWTIRHFTSSQKKIALQFLKNKNFSDALVSALALYISNNTEILTLDSSLGWRNTSVSGKAYWGLSNACFREMDVSISFEILLGHIDKNENRRICFLLFEEFIKKNKKWKSILKEGLENLGALTLSDEEKKILKSLL